MRKIHLQAHVASFSVGIAAHIGFVTWRLIFESWQAAAAFWLAAGYSASLAAASFVVGMVGHPSEDTILRPPLVTHAVSFSGGAGLALATAARLELVLNAIGSLASLAVIVLAIHGGFLLAGRLIAVVGTAVTDDPDRK